MYHFEKFWFPSLQVKERALIFIPWKLHVSSSKGARQHPPARGKPQIFPMYAG